MAAGIYLLISSWLLVPLRDYSQEANQSADNELASFAGDLLP